MDGIELETAEFMLHQDAASERPIQQVFLHEWLASSKDHRPANARRTLACERKSDL